MYARAGANAAMLQKFQQATVTLVNATDAIIFFRFSMGEEQKPTTAAALGALQLAEIAMWTSPPAAQLGEELGFKIWGDGMLQAFGFIVDFEPFHAKHFGQHAFDQVMAESELARDLASGGSEANVAVGLHPNQTIFL